MFALERFRVAIIEKRWDDAWDIANHWWYGTSYKQRTVLFEMLKESLSKKGA